MTSFKIVSESGSFPIAKADMIEGMAKGMAVLESFDTQRQRLNATLAAERAGITRAAARRHLLTLTHLGYLETDGSYFWLAAKVQTRESFSAAVLDGDEVVIIARSGFEWKGSADAKAAPIRVLAYGMHLGARLPAHATSTGRMLLAAKTKSEVNAWVKAKSEAGDLPRLTLHTTTDPRKLKALIDQVRLDDYCVASEEHELGVHALAVPLRDMQGHTVAAINVVTSPQRLVADTLRRHLLPLLLDAARELRQLL
jgi:IclR family pca regulon transcriptional regulator